MSDAMVRHAQIWINTEYRDVAGIPRLEENRRTSWSVMYALTRALQYELGITSLSNAFGPTTLGTLQLRYPRIGMGDEGVPENIIRIIQCGLYCKGYDGGYIDGVFSERTAAGVTTLKQNMGVYGTYPGNSVSPKIFKGLLNMDAYVLTPGGSALVRLIQGWLNDSFIHRADYFVNPCDGHYSRDVQKALMLGIQYTLGMADGVANGNFGPGTKNCLRENTLTTGSSGTWVQLFSAAMIFNRRDNVPFTDSWSTTLADAVREFQRFAQLDVNGTGDYPTWASLLVSYGDDTRRGTAFDCADTVTEARARTLYQNGYRIGGRYLTNVPGTTLDKKIKPGELETITRNGMSCFPIYQTFGDSASYFSREQGTSDAIAATNAALGYGCKRGTRIYFAIDYDNTDDEITAHLIPHFEGINEGMAQAGNIYKVGIYATRNACSRVAAAGLSGASFVSDMSSGYSGNLGFPLPADWAIDQIKTITLGSGDGAIEIDNNIASGREPGQTTFDSPPPTDDLDVAFDFSWQSEFITSISQYLDSIGIPEDGPPADWPSTADTGYTTTECVNFILAYDDLFTSMARTLRMRKALIQVSALWELRHYNTGELLGFDTPFTNDAFSDACVWMYHNDNTVPDWALGFVDSLRDIQDCSTGIGQIFARRAIQARNHAVDLGLLDEPKRNPDNDADIWAVWEKLHYNDAYNISTVPYMHILHSREYNMARPGLTTSETDTQRLLTYYQGNTPEAEQQGVLRMGLYRVIEDDFYYPMRAMSSRVARVSRP